jgi:hypothetical protein
MAITQISAGSMHIFTEYSHRKDEENIADMGKNSLYHTSKRISSQLCVPCMSVWWALNF